PHLKWKLRSKLKELHQKVRATMIYVTHDQTEALTFADQVVVMQEGEVVQIGTPVELFERPGHVFVGHFIGSPGMNVLPCEVRDGAAFFKGAPIAVEGPVTAPDGAAEIGVRPEYVALAADGIEAEVAKVADIGRHKVLEARIGEHRVAAVLGEGETPPAAGPVRLAFRSDQTRVYSGGWLATEARP
ncbi:MAG: ABC transporter ATP-binding protein, partial [Pseudomonadota bacterium]